MAATLLPIGRPLGGTLSDGADVDAFRLDLAGAARVEVRTSGGTDTRGRLLDGHGTVVAKDDDSGPGGHNFSMVAPLDTGVYYVEVQGAAGDYSVMARLAEALDQGDTELASAPLTLHDEEDLADVTPAIRLGASGRIWPSAADVDVFRLDVANDGTDVTVRTSGSVPLRADLLDSALAAVVSDDRGGNVRLESRLDAGTYYVVISGDEVGAYRLLATAEPTGDPCARPAAARDDAGTPAASSLLAVGGSSAAGSISDDSDVDVFRLDLPGNGPLVVRTTGGTDTRGELYDVGGGLIASAEEGGPGGHNFQMELELEGGIYYVAVTGAPGARGEYAVAARAGGAFDHADVPRTSTRLPLYDHADLARVTPDMLLGTAGRIWPSTADVDVFRLDVPRDGTVVRVRTSGGTPLHARLLRAGDALAEVASDDQGDVNMEAPLDAGVYYLRIAGHETGAYRVLAWGYEAGFAPPDKAAFDALVAGQWLDVPSLDTVRFYARTRRFSSLPCSFRGGRYAYERSTCPDAGWLELEYTEGPPQLSTPVRGGVRCVTRLAFGSDKWGSADFSCDDGSKGTSPYFILEREKEAHIADERLADAIRRALELRSCAPITSAAMASLRSVRHGYGVTDLAGLDQAKGLRSLTLQDGRTPDLSPLAGLTSLTRLSLTRHEVSDLSPLAGLTALETLHLRHNEISDLGPLADLTALDSLHLGDNEISDLEALAGLTSLAELDLSDNRISDPSPLTGLTGLRELSLARNYRIADLAPLAGLSELASLDLSHNLVTDLEPLTGLTSLATLDLQNNLITDLEPLASLTTLRSLGLADNRISDPSPLTGLTALRGLSLSRNYRIADLAPLAGLTSLRSLGLADNRVSDLEPLAGLTSLSGLDLSYNRISDLAPLSGLGLRTLDLEGNRISDLSPLSGTTLSPSVFLDLSDNDISDLAPLSGLTFWDIDLSHNEISDLSPFSDMSLSDSNDFPEIRLQGNRISDASPVTRFAAERFRWPFLWNGTVDLGHNALTHVEFETTPATLDLAGNRIVRLGSRTSPRYVLNVEGNLVPTAPPFNSSDQTAVLLAGNSIRDVASLLSDLDRWFAGFPIGVSLWRNPLSSWARDSLSLEALRDYPVVDVVGGGQLIPLLANAPAAGHADRRGVLRLVNLTSEGDAWLYAPRLGDAARPVAVVLPARSAVTVEAEQIRRGERDKRVYGQLPIGSSDAALEVYTSGDIKASAYVRTADGFLTSMHDTAAVDAAGRHVVPFFNPASNTRQRSLLRLVNMGAEDASVSIEGTDDAGMQRGPAQLVLPARAAADLDAHALENGTAAGLSGGLGDGAGRWRLTVSSDGDVAVMSLLDTPTGHLTNLSTTAAENSVPLFPSASHATRQGWVRVVNLGGATVIDIRGVDDVGTVAGPVSVPMAAGHAVDFNSHDWEHGNASKGLVPGAGPGTGDWRLQISSEGDISVGAYVETEDGFLSSVHDRVSATAEPASDCHPWNHRWHRPCRVPDTLHVVAPFIPATAARSDGLVSSVRLLNDDDDDATIVVWRVDERGHRAGPVELALAAGTARTVSAAELIGGGDGLVGRLRDGAGTWDLLVTSSGGRVTVANLLEDAAGHLTNLSTAPYHRVADEYR